MQTITIEGKQFGRGRELFPTWEKIVPDGDAQTLREFIAAIVREQIAGFQERQEERKVLNALTAAQIAEGAAKGKIDSGGRPETDADVDAEAAVAGAIQAFEDGLYFVFINDRQQTELDAPLPLQDGGRVTFLRLVALAGG